ncbi:MAG: PIN domain-containing protein [Caldilineaceae bacterium]|nr:PIN domain-containing protein [Caldilineaceae bacterium]
MPTFDELLYRLLLGVIRDKYGSSPLDRLRQDRAAMIAQFSPKITPLLADLENYPNLTLVDMTATDLAAMHRYMRRYRLLPRDALHLAAMQKVACFNLVSQDADFDVVPEIQRYVLSHVVSTGGGAACRGVPWAHVLAKAASNAATSIPQDWVDQAAQQ